MWGWCFFIAVFLTSLLYASIDGWYDYPYDFQIASKAVHVYTVRYINVANHSCHENVFTRLGRVASLGRVPFMVFSPSKKKLISVCIDILQLAPNKNHSFLVWFMCSVFSPTPGERLNIFIIYFFVVVESLSPSFLSNFLNFFLSLWLT